MLAADTPSRGPTKIAKPFPFWRASLKPIWFESGESHVSMKSVPNAISTSAAAILNCGTAEVPNTISSALRSAS